MTVTKQKNPNANQVSTYADVATKDKSRTLGDSFNARQSNLIAPSQRWVPSRKKPRLSNTPVLDESSSDKKATDSLTFLPLELLGEILVGTHSTRDVLAVARCSKHLWKTLTGPPAGFIWKRTRQVALPEPLPDPPRRLSEPAYAAMVFDGGLCEVCKKYTKNPYLSFALKVRICTSEECRKDLLLERHGFKLLSRDHIFARTPTIEVDDPVFCKTHDSNAPKKYWPLASAWCRTLEWVKSVQDYNGDTETQDHGNVAKLKKQRQEAVKRNDNWMAFCVALRKWEVIYKTTYAANKKSNSKFVTDTARANKLNVDDLSFTSFAALERIRTKCLEPLTAKDFATLAATVKEELEALAEKRKLRERCASYRTVREAIEKHYHQLRSGTPKVILPPFATFRRLPTLALLLTISNPDTNYSIQEILKQNSLRDVIRAELGKWESDARRNMAALLGYSDWTLENEASKEAKVVHPVDRATSWFLCKDCADRARQYEWEMKPLDFVQACWHECPRIKEKKQRYKPWDVSTFVKDDKAVAVTKQFLEICKLDDARTVGEGVDGAARKRRIKCTSCKPFSFMTFDDMIIHCHRHDSMEIKSASDEEMEAMLKPLLGYLPELKGGSGLAHRLMMRKGKDKDIRDFGCRYCLFGEAFKSTDMDAQTLVRKMRKMGVNGLRSHLKAKHGYVTLRDEDVFIFPGVEDGDS